MEELENERQFDIGGGQSRGPTQHGRILRRFRHIGPYDRNHFFLSLVLLVPLTGCLLPDDRTKQFGIASGLMIRVRQASFVGGNQPASNSLKGGMDAAVIIFIAEQT